MRVLSLSTLFPTPEMPHHGIFVFNRINAMARHENVEVTMIAPIPHSLVRWVFKRYRGQLKAPTTRQQGNLSLIQHPRYHSLPLLRKDKEADALFDALKKRLLAQHHEKPFDVIDVHWGYPDLPVAAQLSELLKIPFVITLRGMETFYGDSQDGRPEQIQAALKKAGAVISLSHEMKKYAQEIAGTGAVTTVIRNGVDTERFGYFGNTRSQIGIDLPPQTSLLLGVGSLIERKGFHHVIEALVQLRQKAPEKPITYCILGDTGLEGNFEAELRKKIETYGLDTGTHQVKLMGRIDNSSLPIWYNAADIFCLSSFGEGSPNVLTEALSCGCFSIASNVGAVPDIIDSEPNLGVVIPNQQLSSSEQAGAVWSDAILQAIKQPNSSRQRAAAMKKYTWEWCADNALDVLRAQTKD